MDTTQQQIASANTLAYVRGQEAAFQAVSGHDWSLEQARYRNGFALRGTPARKHKRNRQESKARARWIGLVRFYNPEAFHTGNYQLGA